MQDLIDQIAESQRLLCDVLAGCPESLCQIRPAAGGFAMVEHAWHLADFEQEGIAVRIRRTLTETHPDLPDFNGLAIANARRYIDLAVDPARQRFAAARGENVRILRGVSAADWKRTATQEAVGEVTLEQIARSILVHDISHANEIIELLRELSLTVPADLAALAGTEPLARSA
jgi:hypothetical protein